ncbi:MAG: CPBP family intramembrane metalloprotease [Candidatus Lokiarchaeota archaeon]|nr:CPBP family intramembrane metalloprotease [Candidatus Lokiarchaeota archaeon]MBD3201096.1 CPBP family intramembrane metalloprotease [Candidatus Lokiarchaeota archaeon]
MEGSLIELYKKAKYINREVFFDSQMQSAGSNQARLLERLEKNKSHLRVSMIVMKVVYAFLLCFLPVFPLIAYFQVLDLLSGSLVIESLIFTSSLIFSIFLGMLLLYLILFGMPSTGSFMSGKSFRWIQTLPISKKNIKKLGYVSIFRSLDLPLIVMAISLPVIMLIGTRDILFMIICLVVSIPNVIISYSFLILIGGKISKILFSQGGKSSKKATVIRMATMIGFFLISFSLGFILQWAFSSISFFFDFFMNFENTSTLNLIFSLIPYPFAPSYFLTLFIIPNYVPDLLWITSIIGFILFLIITFGIYRVAVNSLKGVMSQTERDKKEYEPKERESIPEKVEIKTKTPLLAYIRKDLTTASRDFQTFMFFILPIILPFIMILSASASLNFQTLTEQDLLIIWTFLLLTCAFVPAMLISGLLNMEETGSTILASLPIIPRDQAKSKLIIMLTVQTFSFLTPPLILSLITLKWEFLFLTIATLPLAWSFLVLFFELKIKFFGKMKYRYIIEEINRDHKTLKWAVMLLIQVGFDSLVLIITYSILFIVDFGTFLIIIAIMGSLIFGIFWYSFNRLFPKPPQMKDYQTGGALRETPIVGSTALTVIFIGVLFLPGFIELLLIPIISFIPYIALLFIDFSISFSLLTIFWFIIVPKYLNLPEKNQTFKGYLNNINLNIDQPILKNIAIGLISFVIFIAITFIGGNLLGNYVFNPDIVFGTPTFFNFGWFLFIIMLIPGIWEEVSFRGVMIPMISKKYSRFTVILASGILFGLAHSTNFIIVIAEGSPIPVIFQIFYAMFLGFAMAYMFIKTKSLLPPIILHYLIDSLGQLFFNIYFDNLLSYGLFLVFFLGLLPTIVIIVFIRFISND